MAFISSCFLFFLTSLYFHSMSLAQISGTQELRSHGLTQETPVAFSPAAFDFFHPNSSTQASHTHTQCDSPHCAPSPLSSVPGVFSKPQATQVHESVQPNRNASGSGIGAGGITAIVFGALLVVFLAMGVYYVMITRRANIDRAGSAAVRPNV